MCVCVVCGVGVMAVEIQEPQVTIGLDLREMTFQNVVDNILRPSGIKIGGFPEELFLNLTEQEHQDVMCNIWYVISKGRTIQPKLDRTDPVKSAAFESAIQYRSRYRQWPSMDREKIYAH